MHFKCTLNALENEFSRLEIALDYNVFVASLSADSSPTTALTGLVFKSTSREVFVLVDVACYFSFLVQR